MPIRIATPADEPQMAAVCAAAFFDESLFGHVMHPHRHAYPEDFAIYWRKAIRAKFLEPRNRIIVCTTTENGAEQIMGHATWRRQGDDEGARRAMREWSHPGPDPFPPCKSHPNRAIDPAKASLLPDAYPFYKHHWFPVTNSVPRSRNWYLDLCAVHPDFQRRCVGSQLVRWGLDLARAEDVHASVTSSKGNEGFYLRAGFDEIVGDCKEGKGNPLAKAGVEGGGILFMWAKSSEG